MRTLKFQVQNLKNSILTLKTFNGYTNKHFMAQTEVSYVRQEYFQHFEMDNKNNAVLQLLRSLPTPIFLTKDQLLATNRTHRIGSQPQDLSIDPSELNLEQQSESAMETNLAEIEKIVSNTIVQSYVKKAKLDSELNNALVNELLNISPIELYKLQSKIPKLNTEKFKPNQKGHRNPS